MFPKDIIEIIEKYQVNDNYSSQINSSIQSIISVLRDVDTKIKQELINAMSSSVSEEEQALFSDSQVIRNYIESIQLLPQSQNTNTEIAEEITPVFKKNVYPFLVTDDLCPICSVKLIPHMVYYQRLVNNKIINESAKWYRCSVCNKLFALDYEVEDFSTNDTNIHFNTRYYNKILFHDAIVIFNINKCSKHNHETEDLTGELPIILQDGTIKYVSVPIIYCKNCNRYIILKSDYDKLNGIPACVVIDESHTNTEFTENEFYFGDKGGSKLYQYGYNVNCTDKLTVEQRHTILTMQLLSNNMTKGEIYSILDTNISSGNKRKDSKKDWSNAVSKWKSDRDFVQNLDLEQESKGIDIGRIVLKFSTKS